MKRNPVSNILYSLLLVAVFTCISCSHQRDVQLDGGLNADASDVSEQTVASDVATDSQAAAVEAPADEQAAVPTEAPAADAETAPDEVDEATLGLSDMGAPQEEALSESAPLEVAKNDAFNTIQISDVPAAVPQETTTEATLNNEVKERKPAKVFRKKAKKLEKPTKDVIKSEAAPVEESVTQESVSSAPVVNEPVQVAAAAPVVDDEEEDEAQVEPQEASTGIHGFIERNVLWVAATIVGFCIMIFFVARRKKDEDQNMII
jgi:hypothetical protein